MLTIKWLEAPLHSIIEETSSLLMATKKFFIDFTQKLSQAFQYMVKLLDNWTEKSSAYGKINQEMIIPLDFSDHFFGYVNAQQEEKYTYTFESLVTLRKFQEAFEFLTEREILMAVRANAIVNFIDRLIDSNVISLCIDLFRMLIVSRPAVLTKQSVKKLFRIAIRAGHKTICTDLISTLFSRKDFKEYIDLYFRMNQYFLSSMLKNGDYSFAIQAFLALKQASPFDEVTNAVFYYKIYEILIKGCLSKQLDRGEEARALLNEIASKRPSDIFFNKLIDFAAKNSEIAFAEYVFKVMVSHNIQPSIVTYNTLIDSYFKTNRFSQAWILFELLKKTDKAPDNFTYTTMINGLKSVENPDIEKAFILFNEYKQFNKPDQIIYNCLLDACINAKELSKAHELLLEMKQDPSIQLDEITYNTLIKGCCRSKKLGQAIQYYHEMRSNNIKPNRITYNSLIDNCVKANKMRDAWHFYEEMSRVNITPDNFTYSILINGIKNNPADKEELHRALDLLNGMQACTDFKPDEILYNSLIDTCIKFNEISKGLSLFEEMKRRRVEPSSITYGILIKAFGKLNDLVKAFKIFEQMKMKQMKINDVTYGCLLDACVKNDRMDLALELVEKMKQDNIVFNTILCTTLIKGYAKIPNLEEALKIFDSMKENPKAQPNLITYNCIIDACVKADNIALASELFNELLDSSSYLKPDLITYSTLIKGLCRQKDIETAYYYLNLMQSFGIKPDEALFNLILECCHATNYYDLGLQIFEMMNQLRVPPSNITFSILIKLHSRARKIQKVIEVIDIMKMQKVKPTLVIFTNIVQACFKANRFDKAIEIVGILERENTKWDAIFYSKLISGLLSFNRIDMAVGYCERSLDEGIMLGQEVYKQVIDGLLAVNYPMQSEIVQRMEYAMYGTPMHSYEKKISGFKGQSTTMQGKKNQGMYQQKNHYYDQFREGKENANMNVHVQSMFFSPSDQGQKQGIYFSNANQYPGLNSFNCSVNQAGYKENNMFQKSTMNGCFDPFMGQNSSYNSCFELKKSLSLNNKAFFMSNAEPGAFVMGRMNYL